MTRMARADDGAGIAWRSTGEGEPLLLVSGQAVDSSSWDSVAPAFAESFRVIHLRSPWDGPERGRVGRGVLDPVLRPGRARRARRRRRRPGARLRALHGGRVAQWLAIDAPDRVAALVLGASTAGDEGGVPRSPEATADLASGDPDRLARLFFADGHRREDAEAFFDQKATTRAKRLHRQASRTHDTWDLLGQISAPTLVIHGADDEMTPPGNAELVAERIPDSRLALLPGARHGYYLKHPEATEVVVDFLGGGAPPSGPASGIICP